MKIIDAHAHIVGNDSVVHELLESLGVRCLNICVAHQGDGWQQQRVDYRAVADQAPHLFRWMTSFNLPVFDDPSYVDKVIAQLDEDFANGAIAVKIWKNIGMEHRAEDGSYMQIDDPILTPIFEHIAKCGKTLLAHIGEPYACWQPLEFDSPHAGYYKDFPKWHMYTKENVPSHAEIMQAFDHMLEQHPQLKVVGAHLGSQEYDLAVIANRLERFPNFAIDTGARNYDLAFHDRDQVRDLFNRFSDRLLFGIDVGMPHAHADDADRRLQRAQEYRHFCEEAFAFYGTDQVQEMRGKSVRGLNLDPELLERFYHKNARHWYNLSDW